MPSVYLRLPNYVAAWLRHRDSRQPVPTGKPVELYVYGYPNRVLSENLFNDTKMAVSQYSFSERQWVQIRQGRCIDTTSKDYGRRLLPRLEPGCVPDDGMVLRLSGLKSRSGGGTSEWVPLVMPETVECIGGCVLPPTNTWKLTDAGARELIDMLKRECWEEFEGFVDLDERYCEANGVTRTLFDILERLMTRYDIPDICRESIRKELSRRIKSRQDFIYATLQTDQTYADHGESDVEQAGGTNRANRK